MRALEYASILPDKNVFLGYSPPLKHAKTELEIQQHSELFFRGSVMTLSMNPTTQISRKWAKIKKYCCYLWEADHIKDV